MQWQEVAKNLRIGERRKVQHCGTDPSAYISQNAKGMSLHCFRCGENEFIPHGKLSASNVLAMRKRDQAEREQPYPETVELYSDAVPSAARVWLLKAGITPERATDLYGFGYSDKTSRVIIPILHNGVATGGWAGRAIDGRKPKYIMPRGSNGACWYSIRQDRETYGSIVVVEDVLSAIRVREAGYDVLAVLGTSIGTEQLNALAGRNVIGWFDGDEAGRRGYVKLRKRLGPFGVSPQRVQTDKDPKCYSKREIKDIIGEVQITHG